MNSEADKILVADDDAVIRKGVDRILTAEGYAVETVSNGRAALERLGQKTFKLLVTDLKMPGMSGLEVLKAIRNCQPELPVVLMTGYAAIDNAVEAMKNGATDYLAKPFANEELVEKVRNAIKNRAVLIADICLWREMNETHGFEKLVGNSPEMKRLYQRIMQVAPTDSTVLISGESGTGKELVARAIHAHSPRRSQPFVAIDCTSLAESLLESELFGHVKGSFTGAIQTKRGLFEVAEGGTLLLDEIGNISLTTQAKLLRVLQERVITPIGGVKLTSIDIRLIAATNINLREMVSQGRFREDLFFRLNIIPIELPALRDRKGDLMLLASQFLKSFAEENGKEIRGFSPDVIEHLEGYAFPGNVRELENLIERAVVLSQSELIHRHDLEIPGDDYSSALFSENSVPQDANELKERKRQLREQAVVPLERAFLLSALDRNNGNITRAAEEVGMQRPNFQAMLKKLGISFRERMAK
ncbi:MAG: sigma-54-dependent Fis family transcriptional regulator [Desulfuromonadales bacterium]|nr:sigma-54-dependent Fis family transcriptional regulator [Desulfuromonadales bacterium]